MASAQITDNRSAHGAQRRGRVAARRAWAVSHFGMYGAGVIWTTRMQQPAEAPWGLGFISAFFGLAVLAAVWAQLPTRWRGLVVGSLVAPALAAVLPVPSPMSTQGFRDFYEIAVLSDALLTLALVARTGTRDLKLTLLPILAYGLVLENGGILLGAFSEPDYRLGLLLLPGPLATTAGWLVVLTVSIDVTRMLGERWPAVTAAGVGGALGVAACGLALDFTFDPIASATTLWVWHPALPPAYFGVPWLNFVAWTSALLPLGWAVFVNGPGDDGRLWRRIPAVGVAASIIFVLMMLVVDGGVSGPTSQVVRDTAAKVGLIEPADAPPPSPLPNPAGAIR